MGQIKENVERLFKEIHNKTINKNLVIFGEIHGTKEIPDLLSKFLSEIAKEEDFNLCLEIPQEFQKNIEDFFRDKKFNDGRNSLEYFRLIQSLKNLNKRYGRDIKIFCIDAKSNVIIDNKSNAQNTRERIMAGNITKHLNKKTFVILGCVHASKNIIRFQEKIIVPTGNILYKKLRDKMFSINILPIAGEFYNFGVKKITGNLDSPLNKGFDYILKIEEVTPCSFL